MSTFDLGRFRDLAFGRQALPDHPMGTLDEARRLIALLPDDDPAHSLAELTQWTSSMNATDSFTPGRRARVLMLLHEAARPLWRELGQRYLAPDGRPDERGKGDPAILRAMADSAFEFASGFAISLDTSGQGSKWVEKNYQAILIRNLRWLGRRLALAYMLQQNLVAAVWEQLHRLYHLAEERNLLRSAAPVFEGSRHNSSTQAEYARAALVDLANPDGIRAREVELVYRIAARVAPAVRFEATQSTEANFSLLPSGAGRPGISRARARTAPGQLFINTVNCLPRLRAMLERDLGRDPADEDTLFGGGFTLRERKAVLERVIAHWGMDPPRRRTRRIAMASAARVIAGFENILRVVPPADRQQIGDTRAVRRALELKLDESSQTLKRDQVRAALTGEARVVDASAGGIGIAIPRAQAPWATQGALLAVTIEPGTAWFLGVLRRIFSVDDELRLGVQLLAARPTSVAFLTESVKPEQVWEDAIRHERAFDDHYQRGILLEPQALPLQGAQLLLAPGLASRGSQFTVPSSKGQQRIRVTRLAEDGPHYQRAIFETLAASRNQ
ncbi:MAG: hypothetical protein AB7O31_01690 [Burkholderiales bacterium]